MKSITMTDKQSQQWDDDGQDGDTLRREQIAAAKSLSSDGETVEIYHSDGHVVYATA